MARAPRADRREAVRQSARSRAPDWYLAALLAPAERRDDLVTLAAYFGEVANIPLAVSEPDLGLVRLAWWRDTVEAGTETGSPVADAVNELTRRRGLPRELVLLPLIGRARELETDGLAEENDFAAYLAETAGAHIGLAVRLLGTGRTPEGERLCRDAGEAWGRADAAIRLPRHLKRGRLPLPRAILGDEPQAASLQAARRGIGSLAASARAALSRVRAGLRGAPKEAYPAYLPLALVEPYLRALEDPTRDLLQGRAMISPLARVSLLWLAKWKGTI
jgi:phytoene synthase